MKTISRYIMTLALLITAVGGAWADNVEAKIGTTEYATLAQAISSAQDGDIIQLQSDVVLATQISVEKRITIDFNGYIISRAENTYGGIFWKVDMTFIDSDDTGRGGMKCYYNRYGETEAKPNLCGGRYNDPVEEFDASFCNIPTGYEIVNINADGSADADGFISRVIRNYLDDTKTVATIPMPANDVTVNYTLVRDMSIQMTATMGDGTDGVRYRVKKAQQGEGYEPADMNMMQVLALVAVNDGIEQKALTLDQDYFCRIYKLDEQTLQPEGDGVKLSDFDFAPGLYALKAFAQDDSDYDGETALSNTFKLFEGYEVVVAAKEFITYYKDEPLYVEDEDAVLYTITSVNGDQAVLSEKSDAMPSNTPMLVYNKSNETKTFLLIPCAEPDMAITVAPEFQGTLTGTTIAASTDDQTNYALNGKQFVFVKDALEVGPNKAWLSINTGVPSARITLVFDEATGVNEVIGVKEVNDGSWYDLNGRKLNGMPTKKGIYMNNGRKVVVK